LQDQVLPLQVNREKSVWWDNISSKDKIETRSDIVNLAFKNAIVFLQNQLGENMEDWTWNRVLSIEHEHAIGKAGGLLRKFFNVGPFETIGGNEVINNQIFNLDSTGYYKVTAGPSTRRIVDFSDVENSLAILPTGQSGNVFSEYYKDQTEKYLEGEFVKMNLNQAEIEQSKNVLTLKTEK
jgi:penicillin amidase